MFTGKFTAWLEHHFQIIWVERKTIVFSLVWIIYHATRDLFQQIEKRTRWLTSPPTANLEPSLLNVNANCCPTSSNWVRTFSDTLTPSLWISLTSRSSHSNNLKKNKNKNDIWHYNRSKSIKKELTEKNQNQQKFTGYPNLMIQLVNYSSAVWNLPSIIQVHISHIKLSCPC